MGSNDAPVFDASPCGDADGCILCRTNPITGPIPVKKSYDATQLQVAPEAARAQPSQRAETGVPGSLPTNPP
jgi:hypothetical protein